MKRLKTKNVAKGNSYALAFRLLDDSIRHKYPLRAITIEESILADRLWSALNAGKTDGGLPGTLGCALKAWRPKSAKGGVHHNAALLDEMIGDYFERLEKWWDNRNQVLHGMVKSFTGKAPEISADQFEQHAFDVAIEGYDLVKIVRDASLKSIRQYNTTKKGQNHG